MLKTEIKTNKNQHAFQMFFLKNNMIRDIQELEVKNIDFEKVKNHLENGESIYITSEPVKKPSINFIAYEKLKEPWYFVRS